MIDDGTALVERWAEAFNNDVDHLIDELYAPNCTFLGVEPGRSGCGSSSGVCSLRHHGARRASSARTRPVT